MNRIISELLGRCYWKLQSQFRGRGTGGFVPVYLCSQCGQRVQSGQSLDRKRCAICGNSSPVYVGLIQHMNAVVGGNKRREVPVGVGNILRQFGVALSGGHR